MGKRKQKPLLADQGILHLNSCFVQPSEESGLLTTVGGQEQPLVLASGSYGYGVPLAVAQKAVDAAAEKKNQEEDPDVVLVREMNGGAYSATDLEKDRTGAQDEINPEEMSVAELVRSIGGAKDAPYRRCDVVFTEKETEKENEERERAENGQVEQDPQADEFYASLGLENPREKRKKDDEEEEQEQGEAGEENKNKDNPKTDGIRDFYRTYTQYYYSKDPNPLSDQPLPIGLPIQPGDKEGLELPPDSEQTIIQLARMAQLRAKQAKAAADALEKAKRAKAIGQAPVSTTTEVVENEADIYDPLPMEVVPSSTASELGITVDTTLEQYWEFVKEDPHDFNRWIYLIHYAESKENIASCRKVYGSFLPLFPYCFGYWKRYSEMEKKFNYYGRALTILERGLEFIPLSVDLWMSYINLYREINAHEPNLKDLMREQYERALNTCGMEFRSDSLWESFIQFEIDNHSMRRAFALYCRVIQVPSRLYNRHWDNIRALIRDHHPRDFLFKEEFEHLRKKGCKKLGFKYKEEPEVEQGEVLRKPSKPEDQLMAWLKEKVLKRMTKIHDKCEAITEKRWVYEDRIRRPYFHTKPLDKYQLRNWEEYLNFEISEGDHDRIVLLFERCLIACALYENFWAKYASYLESYHKKSSPHSAELSVHFLKVQENTEIGSKQETEEEELRISDVTATLDSLISQVEDAEAEEEWEIEGALNHITNSVCVQELAEKSHSFKLFSAMLERTIGSSSLSSLSPEFFQLAEAYEEKVNSVGYIAATEELRSAVLDGLKVGSGKGPSGRPCSHSVSSGPQGYDSFLQSDPDPEPDFSSSTLLSVPDFPPAKYAWQEAVRDVYKRACIVHCPKRPGIRLQWAAFEEELGNSDDALSLLRHVENWFPNHLEAKLFILEISRRKKKADEVVGLYEKYLKASLKKKEEYSMFSMKYARYLHKEMKKPDKALKILRQAIKKDKSNPRLYSYVFEICYEKYPDDKKAALAALELAVANKDFSAEQRLAFLKKKLLFLQEHADIRKYRDCLQQLTELQEVVRQKETEELRKKEEEMRLKIGNMNPHLARFPVPDWTHVNESQNRQQQQPVPIDFEPVVSDRMVEDPSQRQGVPSPADESDQFKKVPPPEGLNLSNYGYASKHPDYKLAEYMGHKEYEQLESKGYPEHIKDKEGEAKRRKLEEEKERVYIVHPKSATLYMSSAPNILSDRENPSIPGAKGPEVIELEAPQKLSSVAVPSTSPCINVPDWFVKEGGELCLSETRAGFSVLRYWPHFLNDLGQQKMFKSVRRSVKWHQKQRVVWSQWRYVPRLVSWLGPCEWADRGLELKKNEDWPPEILDLLHRINQITSHEFNSCFLNLYRTGHDSHPWHGDIHPAYGANPPVATISLGSLRLFEMKRRGPTHNFLRFPLFPGSLLIMEGACQVDWSHQIPKDPKVEGERISLVFRVMHAIEPLQKQLEPKDRSDEEEEEDEVTEVPPEKRRKTDSPSDSSKTKPKKKGSEREKISDPMDPLYSPPRRNKSRDPSPEVVEVPRGQQTKIIFHNSSQKKVP